jgi:hypothetical protein
MRVLTEGWVGLGFSDSDAMVGSDAYIGSYKDGKK